MVERTDAESPSTESIPRRLALGGIIGAVIIATKTWLAGVTRYYESQSLKITTSQNMDTPQLEKQLPGDFRLMAKATSSYLVNEGMSTEEHRAVTLNIYDPEGNHIFDVQLFVKHYLGAPPKIVAFNIHPIRSDGSREIVGAPSFSPPPSDDQRAAALQLENSLAQCEDPMQKHGPSSLSERLTDLVHAGDWNPDQGQERAVALLQHNLPDIVEYMQQGLKTKLPLQFSNESMAAADSGSGPPSGG